MTFVQWYTRVVMLRFQYRKRYEVTCDKQLDQLKELAKMFQYRKRYEVTCDTNEAREYGPDPDRFNTASGMRSHVTAPHQYPEHSSLEFQYRKRYEVTCDAIPTSPMRNTEDVSIPQAV